jgi:hypothetical protein
MSDDKLPTADEVHAELIERLKDPTLTGIEADAFRAGAGWRHRLRDGSDEQHGFAPHGQGLHVKPACAGAVQAERTEEPMTTPTPHEAAREDVARALYESECAW